jgi:hypothetical protein
MSIPVGRLPRESGMPVHPRLRSSAVAATLLLAMGAAAWGASRPGEGPLPAGSNRVASAGIVPVIRHAVEEAKTASRSTAAVPVTTNAHPVPAVAAAVVKTAPPIAVPPNPFVPTEPDPLPAPLAKAVGGVPTAEAVVAEAFAPGFPVGEGGSLSLPPVGSVGGPGTAGQTVAGLTPGGKATLHRLAEEPEIVGIVQGEPPLAVAKSDGQSFYLKVGDQIADTWRLVAIKDRSVVFRLGGRRVEVPIQGGNSE